MTDFNAVIAAMIVVIMFGASIIALGTMVDGAGEYKEQHERCLKLATDGFAIEKCR